MADHIRDIIEYKLQIANGEEQLLNVLKFDTTKIPAAMKDRLVVMTKYNIMHLNTN